MKTGLEGKPWFYGAAAGLVVGAMLFGLAYWRFFDPMNDQIDGLERKLSGLQEKIQEGRAAQAQLPKFREEVHQLELELDKLLRILPARRNTPDLLRRIRTLAEQGDFALKRFTPGQLTDRDFFSEWPIAIEVDGTYHNLALFFDRISRFSRIINIEDLGINAISAKGNPHTISAAFTAKTFVYREEDPTPAPGTAGAPPAPAAGGPATRRPAKGGGGGE